MPVDLPMIGGDNPTFPINCPNCNAEGVPTLPGNYVCGAAYHHAAADNRWIGSCPVDTGRGGNTNKFGGATIDIPPTQQQTIAQQRATVVSLLSEPGGNQPPISEAVRQTLAVAANTFAEANDMALIVPGKFFDFLTDEIVSMLKTGIVPRVGEPKTR